MIIYTIGFTGKTAREFFTALSNIEALYLLDIRIRNNSQLAGFTKKGNIEFFIEELTKLTYEELPLLAPSPDMFAQYRAEKDWDLYERRYLDLLKERDVRRKVDTHLLASGAVLLCSEPTAEKCHRRLASKYLKKHLFPEANIVHL